MYFILTIVIILQFVCAYFLRKKYDPGRNKETLVSCFITSMISLITNSIYQMHFLLDNGFILVYYDIYRYSFFEFFVQSLFYIIMTDFMLYVVHRLLHCKILYKYVHYFHHTNINPTAFDFASIHPIESIMVFTTFHITAFIIPVYIAILELYILHVGLRSLLEHGNGWKVIEKVPILKHMYNNHHNVHHKYFAVNYGLGSYPAIWDKVFNTLRD